jgi:RDD family
MGSKIRDWSRKQVSEAAIDIGRMFGDVCRTTGEPVMSLETEVPVRTPRYARFTRRLRGIVIDWFLVMILLFGALFVAVSVRSDHFSRTLGILVVLVLVLYEPVLVSLTGGTLGHYFTNLRVVDERDQGNVSFLKALARLALKSLLGWYSFIVMTATRRNQAMHDLLTRSTVQIRDPAKARPHHYITERADFQSPDMPSRLRRVVVICAYLLLTFVAGGLVFAVVASATGALLPCIDYGICSGATKLLENALAVIWLVSSAACVGLGWRGKLPGARRRA